MAKNVTYELIAKYFTGNCTDVEKAEIENWRNKNTENLEVFNQYRVIWENARKPVDIEAPDVEEALLKVKRKLPVDAVPERKVKVIPLKIYISRIAAAVLVSIGLWLAFTLIRQKQESAQMLVFMSDKGKKELTLADGTHIWLNKNTLVRYPLTFEGKERKIFIEGEAYFDVAKNADFPFVIETENAVVRVVGTEFNLRARKNESLTEVVVTEGKVAFKGKTGKLKNPIFLVAGDRGLLIPANNELKLEKNRNINVLSWKTGKLIFDNTPLTMVASDLSEYYGVTIAIADTTKNQIPITSVFENKSLQEILGVLDIMGIKSESKGQKIWLK